MAQYIFAEQIGRLVLKPLPPDRRNSSDTVYWISKSARASKKYNPLRNTEFIIRPIAKNTYQVLINEERFEVAYTAEDAPIILERAFDHECIKAGIASASPKFSFRDEPVSTRRTTNEQPTPIHRTREETMPPRRR